MINKNSSRKILRSRKTIDRNTAEFIQKQVILSHNINTIKERSNNLIELARSIESKLDNKKKKSKKKKKKLKKEKFNPKDLAFDILMENIMKITEKKTEGNFDKVKSEMANLLNGYLKEKKVKFKFRSPN